jgi:hypothetical protein
MSTGLPQLNLMQKLSSPEIANVSSNADLFIDLLYQNFDELWQFYFLGGYQHLFLCYKKKLSPKGLTLLNRLQY